MRFVAFSLALSALVVMAPGADAATTTGRLLVSLRPEARGTAHAAPPNTPVEWWPAREDFPRAWDFTTGTGALVGVIDTGVDATHPDLASKVKAADDFHSQTRHGPATTDDVGHGTHVASIACA